MDLGECARGQIIEYSDNRRSDNRGSTVCDLQRSALSECSCYL